jgi:glycosyltransferase involved in cell wall biosynthesis
MKVGFDGKFIGGSGATGVESGNGVHAREILRHLMMIDNEIQYTVYLLGENHLLPSKDNFRFKTLVSMSKNSYLRNLLVYPVELAFNHIDIFQAFTTVPSFFSGKVILFLFDIFWIVHPEWIPKRKQIPLDIMTRRSVKRADRILTLSQFSKDEIVKHLHVPEEKVNVIYCGLGDNFLEKSSELRIEEVKSKYSINGNYILSVNDIHPRKNIDKLVKAFCYLKETGRIDHKLVLTGRTRWNSSNLLKSINYARFRDDIILTGYVPLDDLAPLYSGGALFVYPSFYEGFGLQVLEAMASDTPVAVGNRSSLPEIAGNAAVQFDPYDIHNMGEVILHVLENVNLQKELVNRGRERIKDFSWIESANKLLKVYNEVYQDG